MLTQIHPEKCVSEHELDSYCLPGEILPLLYTCIPLTLHLFVQQVITFVSQADRL